MKYVRHWRLFWLPWFSLCIGRCDGRKAIWIEAGGKNGYVFCLTKEPK